MWRLPQVNRFSCLDWIKKCYLPNNNRTMVET